MKKITIIVPCYNEQENLHEFYRQIKQVHVDNCVFSCFFIDDGSIDSTRQILHEFSLIDEGVSYISFTRNFGKEAAMMAGLDYVDADAVIIMDADLQHPIGKIPEMIALWLQGYDDVCGKRRSREDESYIKKTFADIFYKIYKKINPLVQRDVGDFRLLDRRCVSAIRLLREKQRFTKGIFTWIGYNKKEFLYDVNPRFAGTSKWHFTALLRLAVEALTSFSTVPLRLVSGLGVVISIFALTYMVYVFIIALLYGDPVAGYPTIMVTLLLLGGIQLLSLGVIGEYLGKVFGEAKARPVYLIDEYNGSKVIYSSENINVIKNNTIMRKDVK